MHSYFKEKSHHTVNHKHGPLPSLPPDVTYRHRRWMATFNLHTLVAEKQIQAAELRIRLPRSERVTNISVDIYHQQDRPCQPGRACHRPQLVGSLTAAAVISSSQSWKVFNVTAPLLRWLQENQPSRGRRKGGPAKKWRKRKAETRGGPPSTPLPPFSFLSLLHYILHPISVSVFFSVFLFYYDKISNFFHICSSHSPSCSPPNLFLSLVWRLKMYFPVAAKRVKCSHVA